MKEYFTFNMAINIDNRWFLPHQQYEIVETEMIPLVSHSTRSGWPILKTHARSLHYHIDCEDGIYIVPCEAGAVLDFEIPKEFINKYVFEERMYSDNITDYIEAAAKYLNIEIRFRPETAKWYRDGIKASKTKTQIPEKVGREDINT